MLPCIFISRFPVFIIFTFTFTLDYFVAPFYSASALLAMHSAVLARAILSVCHSVTFGYCVQTNLHSCGFQRLIGQSF